MSVYSPERINKVAFLVLQYKLEEEGKITLRPKEIRRDVHNWAKKLNLPAREMAQLLKIILMEAYNKTLSELEKIQD